MPLVIIETICVYFPCIAFTNTVFALWAVVKSKAAQSQGARNAGNTSQPPQYSTIRFRPCSAGALAAAPAAPAVNQLLPPAAARVTGAAAAGPAQASHSPTAAAVAGDKRALDRSDKEEPGRRRRVGGGDGGGGGEGGGEGGGGHGGAPSPVDAQLPSVDYITRNLRVTVTGWYLFNILGP
jgi:hypothetical protein